MRAGRIFVSSLLLIGSVSAGLSPPAVPRRGGLGPAIGFSSYLGGVASEELPRVALALDGGVYMVGTTSSADLRVGGGGASDAALAGDTDAFLARLTAAGRLAFVTYIGGGGADRAGGVAVGPAGEVWVSGQTTSADFPAAEGALSGPADAFAARVDPASGAVAWSTYIGGGGIEAGAGIAVDADGRVYVTGTTNSDDFPRASTRQESSGGGTDAFVVGLPPWGGEPRFVTAIGDSHAEAEAIYHRFFAALDEAVKDEGRE